MENSIARMLLIVVAVISLWAGVKLLTHNPEIATCFAIALGFSLIVLMPKDRGVDGDNNEQAKKELKK